MPRARLVCLLHFVALATTLAVARVLLNTIGATLFLVHEGTERLPLFYIVLAATMVLLSFGLSRVIDRLPRIRLAQAVFAGCLLGAASLRWPVALDAPGVYFVLLASAHIYEIVLDIMLWVVIAGFTDSVELKRSTPLVYMALAIGGAIGGGAAHAFSALMTTADMLLLLPLLAAALVMQLGLIGSRLHEVPDDPPERGPAGAIEGPTGLLGLVRRFPLSLLIALNALVMTILYGLSEYLVFSVYTERFPEERELARFLALVFALLQTIEFILLYAVSWPLLERTGPLVRNLVFPLTSFASLAYLIASQKLPAALLLHVNAEAVSNAIYQPVSNANYIPLPLRFQGRARTLADGVFYPTGLALAGVMLIMVPEQGVITVVGFIASAFVLIFALLGVGIGVLFLPTLRANVGAGLITPGEAVHVEPLPAARVRTLLRSREPELRLHGLAMARHLSPDSLEDDLLALAKRPDRTTRTVLAQLVAAGPRHWTQRFIDRCLAARTEGEAKLGLLVLLIRRAPLRPEQLARLGSAQDPAVPALAHLVNDGLRAWERIRPGIRNPSVASDLAEAIVCAERHDFGLLLLACLGAAEAEQQGRALAMLNRTEGLPVLAASDVLHRLARSANAAVRAEAIVLLSRASPGARAVRLLVAALDDGNSRVRRSAAQALRAHRDRAVAILRHRLGEVTAGSIDALRIVAAIGSPQGRRVLATFVQALHEDTGRTAHLLERIAAAPDRQRWSAIELCLQDHRVRLVDATMTVLAPAIESRLERRVRQALHSASQRSRASAFELIAAAPRSRIAPGAMGLLRLLLFDDGAAGLIAVLGRRREDLLAQAAASMSPWVRRAASLLASQGDAHADGDAAMTQDQDWSASSRSSARRCSATCRSTRSPRWRARARRAPIWPASGWPWTRPAGTTC